jgi:hypothetical protein
MRSINKYLADENSCFMGNKEQVFVLKELESIKGNLTLTAAESSGDIIAIITASLTLK